MNPRTLVALALSISVPIAVAACGGSGTPERVLTQGQVEHAFAVEQIQLLGGSFGGRCSGALRKARLCGPARSQPDAVLLTEVASLLGSDQARPTIAQIVVWKSVAGARRHEDAARAMNVSPGLQVKTERVANVIVQWFPRGAETSRVAGALALLQGESSHA